MHGSLGPTSLHIYFDPLIRFAGLTPQPHTLSWAVRCPPKLPLSLGEHTDPHLIRGSFVYNTMDVMHSIVRFVCDGKNLLGLQHIN